MTHRHWLFPASGAAYGLAFWYLIDYDLGYAYGFASLMTFIAAQAFCSWFAIGTRHVRDDVAFAVIVPLVAALQVFGFQYLVGFEYVDENAIAGLLICQALWVSIATAAWRLWMPIQTTVLPNHPDRSALVSEIWSIKLSLGFGVVALAVMWPLLWALTSLLSLVGLTGLLDYLTIGWIAMPLSGVPCATGVLIAREKAKLLIPIRQVIGGIFRVLYPVQALGLFVFLVAAALGGWEVLIAQDYGVWWTVMAAAAGLTYLLFGTVQASDGVTLFGRLGDRIFRFTLWMAPLFGVLAIYTIWLRVADYGLTPSRVYGIWAALFVLFATLWLAIAAFGRRQSTPAALRNTFGHVVICLGLMAFVIHMPFLDPVSMAARSQQARLTSLLDVPAGTELATDVADDLAFLAGELGKPGEGAITDLRLLNADQVSDLADLRAYRSPDQRESVDAADIPVFPQGHGLGDDVLNDLLEDALRFDRGSCYLQSLGSQNVCAVLLVDLDGDGNDEAVFFNARDYAGVYRYVATDADWRLMTNLQIDDADGDRGQLLRDLANGQFDLIAPRISDLQIGSIRWRQNP